MNLKIVHFLLLICLFALVACNNDKEKESASGLPAPAVLTAKCANSSMTVSWFTVKGAESYGLFLSTEKDGDYTPIISTSKLFYTISGLTNGSTYWVKEASINGIGTGGFSTPVSCVPALHDSIPVKPGSLIASAGDSTVTLQWAAADKADSYNIYQANIDGSTTIIKSLTDLTYTIAGLTNGTSYIFFVTAINEKGESEGSERLSVTPIKAVIMPSAPANLSAIGGNKSVVLNWDESSGAVSYYIFKSSEINGQYALIGTILGRTYTVSDLTNGQIYWFKVAASNSFGTGEQSAAISATPTVPMTPPVAVTGLNATSGDSKIELSWDLIPNVSSYNVYISNSPSGPFTLAVNTGMKSYSASGLTNGNTYWFRVSGVNEAGEGPEGTTVFALAKSPVNVPVAPAALNILPGNQSASLSWSESPNASSYVVYQSDSQYGTYQPIATLSPRKHNVYGLNNGTTYWFAVSAANSAGIGVKSNQVSVTSAVPVTAPAAPAGLSAVAAESAAILKWDASSGATQYHIHQSTGSDPYVKVKSTVSNNANITGLTNGKTYNFKVLAVNDAGESAESMPASTTPAAPTTAPAAPSGISITAGDTSAMITWEPVTGATSYVIYLNSGIGGDATLDTVSASPYRVTGLSNGTQYSFKVASVNSVNIGTKSAGVSVTPAVPTVMPAVPVWVSALPGDTKVSLQWSEPVGAQSYNVYQSSDKINFTKVKSVTTPNTTIEGLTNGTSYYFKVSAANSTGENQMSNINSAELTPRKPTVVPGRPYAVNATAGNNSVTISWAAVPQAYSYEISSSSSEQSVYIPVGKATTLNFTLPGLANGTLYWFRVTAENAVGTGTPSVPVSVTPMAPVTVPALPSAVSASAGDSAVKLSWPAVSEATHYNIYQLSAESGAYILIKTVTTLAATINELTNGTQYYFRVSAINSAGESPMSLVVSATPKVPLQAPLAPLGLNVGNASSAVVLSWAASANTDIYTIQTSSTDNGNYTTVATTNQTTYRVAGLTNGKTYWFKLTASNAAGESPLSSPAFGIPAAATTVLPPPINISIAPGDEKVSMAWSPVAGATEYWIQFGYDPNYYNAATSTSASSLSLGGLINNKTIYFKISTKNEVGMGKASEPITTILLPPSTKPAIPTGLNAVAGDSRVTLSWNYSNAASSYYIYRSTTQNGTYEYVRLAWDNQAVDYSVTNGQIYWYKVTGRNSLGESQQSAAISVTPAIPVFIPTVPTGLSASPANGQVSLTWSAVSGATSYNIYIAKTGDEFILKGSTTTPSYTAQNLINDSVYQFKVTAFNSAGESAQSVPVSAKPVASIMPAPTNLTATPRAASALLTWDIVEGATTYTIFMSQTGQQGAFNYVGETPENGSTFTINNLTPLGSYWFKIKANKNGESSNFSQPVSVTIPK